MEKKPERKTQEWRGERKEKWEPSLFLAAQIVVPERKQEEHRALSLHSLSLSPLPRMKNHKKGKFILKAVHHHHHLGTDMHVPEP